MRLLIVALSLVLALPALAQDHRGGGGEHHQGGGGNWNGGGHNWNGGGHYYRGYNNGVGSIIVGTAIGGILGNIFAPPPVIVVPAAPPVVVPQETEAQLVPWSPEWYASCVERYKSFDTKTGLWIGESGNKHFCQ